MGKVIKAADVVLVVQDEPIIRMVGVDMLEDTGYHVLEAASADEAISILENAPDVRLIFSDVDRPGCMDGVALAEFVHPRWPKIRLILTSGHRDVSENGLPDDGRFLPKPYSHDQVIEQIRNSLD